MRNIIFRLALPLIIIPILSIPILILHPLPQATPAVPQTTTVDYVITSTLLANPERGFYHHTETHSNNYTPLDLATLQVYRQYENITLILRVFYLEDFAQSEISPAYLDKMQADFDTVREAGLKMIVRFAYTNQLHFASGTDWPPIPPYGDAPKAQILEHLEQLQPILQANDDVIAAMQAGFIGVWGEWYYTDYFVEDPDNPDQITEEDWANRRDVLAKIFEVLPDTRMVQLRTPFSKQQIFSRTLPITLAEAHNSSNIARTGHHNDCFLASDTDFGTYRTEVITAEKDYLAQETKYLPMGGETCAPNPPRSECQTAIEELSRFHWSYLNIDYHPEVIDSWDTICLDDIKRHLGHRLALVEGAYQDMVQPGDTFTIEIKLQNEGWAAPLNPRPVELLLRHKTSGKICRVKLPDDLRFWLPEQGEISLIHTIHTSAGWSPGRYELLLNLPDPEPTLYSIPAYGIRLANELVWEQSTGYNNLSHTLVVTGPVISPDPDNAALSAVCDILYLPLILKS